MAKTIVVAASLSFVAALLMSQVASLQGGAAGGPLAVQAATAR